MKRITATKLDAAFDAIEFRKDLDVLLTKHGASLRMMRVQGAVKLQARFANFPTLALTMIELPAQAVRGATRGYMRMDATTG